VVGQGRRCRENGSVGVGLCDAAVVHRGRQVKASEGCCEDCVAALSLSLTQSVTLDVTSHAMRELCLVSQQAPNRGE
jgi:hypothetical protein